MRSIRNLLAEIPSGIGNANFGDTYFLDKQGKKHQAYNITKDGFILLAMGFTGKKALEFKIEYIEQFNHLMHANQQGSKALEILQKQFLETRPYLNAVLELKKLGYSNAKVSEMLGLGKTAIYNATCKLSEVGLWQKRPQPTALINGGL